MTTQQLPSWEENIKCYSERQGNDWRSREKKKITEKHIVCYKKKKKKCIISDQEEHIRLHAHCENMHLLTSNSLS